MSNLTTKSIINILPFDPKQKLEILESYDSLSKEEQIKITRIVWAAFEDYEDLKLNQNFINGLDNPGETPLDGDYYKKIADQTSGEINTQLSGTQQVTDLSEVRKSMEKIVKEINAAKIQTNKQNTP